MEKIQETIKVKHDTEREAVEFIDAERKRAKEEGFEIKKSGYVRKSKKSKGVEIAEWYISEIVYKYAEEYVAEEA
jgi:hypothetical protein